MAAAVLLYLRLEMYALILSFHILSATLLMRCNIFFSLSLLSSDWARANIISYCIPEFYTVYTISRMSNVNECDNVPSTMLLDNVGLDCDCVNVEGLRIYVATDL